MHERINKLKNQNADLTTELELSVETDAVIRQQLEMKHTVRKFKEYQFKGLSESKTKLVERTIHDRYDIGGLERLRRSSAFIGEDRPSAAAAYGDQDGNPFLTAPGAGYLRPQTPLRNKGGVSELGSTIRASQERYAPIQQAPPQSSPLRRKSPNRY